MRSHLCGDLRSEHIGQSVRMSGWVHRRRDHGGVIFLDVRDHRGIVQVVFDPDTEEHFALADQLRNEYVVSIQGVVRARDEAAVNPKMSTGEIEVLGQSLELLNRSKTPPSLHGNPLSSLEKTVFSFIYLCSKLCIHFY